jgi:hypothetical protein
LGQFSFTVTIVRLLVIIIGGGQGSLPTYAFNGTYGLSWRITFFRQCEISATTCSSAVPETALIELGLAIVVLMCFEILWLWRIVREFAKV